MPGNSIAIAQQVNSVCRRSLLRAAGARRRGRGTCASRRQAVLDGTPATVALDLAVANSGNVECYGLHPVPHDRSPGRSTSACSDRRRRLIPVIEYYHAGLDHYFMTVDRRGDRRSSTTARSPAGRAPATASSATRSAAAAADRAPRRSAASSACRPRGSTRTSTPGSARECHAVNVNFVGAWADRVRQRVPDRAAEHGDRRVPGGHLARSTACSTTAPTRTTATRRAS